MNANDILTLLKAGYTKAEIDAMNAPQPDPQPQPQPQPDPQPQPQPQPDPQPQPQPQPTAQDPSAQLAAVLASMQETLKQMQAANIAGSNNPEPKTTHDQAMEIMANIIAPPKKGNKTK